MPEVRKPHIANFVSPVGLLSRILETTPDAIISVDEHRRIHVFNRGAEKIFGYRAADVAGKDFEILVPARFRTIHRDHMRRFASGSEEARMMGERGQVVGQRQDGSEFPAEASISKVEFDGAVLLTVILRDVSGRMQVEERVRASLEEKEVLLEEIHHRVKNNLQVVSSLLNLQARAAQDAEIQQVFQESRNRVQSMAMVHEQLYRSKSLADLNFGEYVSQLAETLFRAYRVDPERVTLRVAAGKVRLDLDAAAPCGLILNELVSNALKHAFPDGRSGEVEISVHENPDRSVTLSVADDGVGVPEGIGFWNAPSLGWKLVRTLVRQIDGEAQIEGPPGTRLTVRFSPDAANHDA